ncbi:hypothetical protein BHE74_00018363 [Ensete ventricosum]|nr:hypothetical protein BHE74_00018363 [Ensete ventricosum]
MIFNGFGAFDCIGVRSCTERRLCRFPGSGLARATTVGTMSKVANTFSDLACPGYRVVEVVVHVVPRLTRRG